MKPQMNSHCSQVDGNTVLFNERERADSWQIVKNSIPKCLPLLPGAYVRSVEGCSRGDYHGDDRDQPPDCRPHSGWSIQLWTSWLKHRYRRPIASIVSLTIDLSCFARPIVALHSAPEKQDSRPVNGSESKMYRVDALACVAMMWFTSRFTTAKCARVSTYLAYLTRDYELYVGTLRIWLDLIMRFLIALQETYCRARTLHSAPSV